MSDQEIRIVAQRLRDCASEIFAGRGMRPEDARRVAEVLVWADAGGHGSHGVSRIKRYLKFIDKGDFDPSARPVTTLRAGAVARIDGHRSAGAVAMTEAVGVANELAEANGAAVCIVGETTHIGAAGYYAEQLALEGRIGIVCAASGPLMAYHGAAVAGVSTAPLAFGIPAGQGGCLLMDMACSVASLGKIREAAASGRPIPPVWALDAEGQPTTDPAAAAVQLPLGGAKGSGIALMVECMASLLAGAPLLAPALMPQAQKRHSQNAMIIVIDVARFVPLESFAGNAKALAETIRALPPSGEAPILMPGERSQALRLEAWKSGVPIRRSLWEELTALRG